jgi:hypothetical protein
MIHNEVKSSNSNIAAKSEVIIDLLNNISHFTETNERKEADND